VLFVAQLVSNIGTWMQSVGAVWLMGDLGGSPLLIASVQTASTLPVFVVGIFAGSLADIFDRRRLLLVTQTWMLLAAGVLAALTAAGATRPLSLLGCTFALGLGAALNGPAWQAIQPSLVPAEEFPQAVTWGSASVNIGRAVGPAIGGVIVATSGPAAVFAVNAASFVAVLVALASWHAALAAPTSRERLWRAIRAGFRYSRHAHRFRSALARAVLYLLPASAVMAMLPLVVRNRLHLGSGSYGALLAVFGLGAVSATLVLPALRERLSTDRIVELASLAIAATLAAMALSDQPVIIGAALLVGGLGWLAALTTFNVTTQRSVPDWVRARGLGLYMFAMQGSIAAGSTAWGATASSVGVTPTLLIAGAGLVVGAAVGRLLPLDTGPELALAVVSDVWPEPATLLGTDRGPTMVSITYRVHPDQVDAFITAMHRLERARRRTGANRWTLWRDPAHPDQFTEQWEVDSWTEHLRQHQRVTETDHQIQTAVNNLLTEPAEVRHFVAEP
jgi:MFS family permease/quinol monooxygenase YgiN